jgi:hypothetical protein
MLNQKTLIQHKHAKITHLDYIIGLLLMSTKENVLLVPKINKPIQIILAIAVFLLA